MHAFQSLDMVQGCFTVQRSGGQGESRRQRGGLVPKHHWLRCRIAQRHQPIRRRIFHSTQVQRTLAFVLPAREDPIIMPHRHQRQASPRQDPMHCQMRSQDAVPPLHGRVRNHALDPATLGKLGRR